jgi:hypothetical protein
VNEASGNSAAINRRHDLWRVFSKSAFEFAAFSMLVAGGHRFMTAASPRNAAVTRQQTQRAWNNFERMADSGERGEDFINCWLERLLATPGFIQNVRLP